MLIAYRHGLRALQEVRRQFPDGLTVHEAQHAGELGIVMVVVEELFEYVQGAFETEGLRGSKVLRQIGSVDLLDCVPGQARRRGACRDICDHFVTTTRKRLNFGPVRQR